MIKRNLFLTKTAIGVYLSLLATVSAIAPNIESLLTRGKSDNDKMNARDYIAIVVAINGAIVSLFGRYNAGGVYTPKYLPGEDPESLQ
jgi:hypothetical protein